MTTPLSTKNASALASLSGEPPSLPTEVVEKILKYAFLPPSPLVPSSDPFHLRGTSHILLVSRAIRKLALPFFYHTVNITRASDYVTFFDSLDGIFHRRILGVSGPERWSWVKQLGIVAMVDPAAPEEPEVDEDEYGQETFTFPIDARVPKSHRIDTLCLLARQGPLPAKGDPSIETLVATMEKNEEYRDQVTDDLERELGNQLIGSLEMWAQFHYQSSLGPVLDRHVRWAVIRGVCKEREAFTRHLWCSTSPRAITWIADSLQALRETLEEPLTRGDFSGTVLSVYPATSGGFASVTLMSRSEGRAPLWEDFILDVIDMEKVLGVRSVRLEGFPQRCLDEVEKGWPHLAKRYRTRATWSWTQEDGSVFSMDPPAPRP